MSNYECTNGSVESVSEDHTPNECNSCMWADENGNCQYSEEREFRTMVRILSEVSF